MSHDRAPRLTGLSLDDLRALAAATVADLEPGEGLDPLERELVTLAIASSTTALALDRMQSSMEAALGLGATPEQVVEVLLLVAPLGMHTLHEGIRELRPVLDRLAPDRLRQDLDDEQRALRDTFEGHSSYWERLDAQLPGFIDGLLRLSPTGYRAFFEFCAVAWKDGSLPALTRELVYLAIDATPTHRYGPGFRLHLDNAIRLGATRRQVHDVLELAAAGPEHLGVP